MKSIFFLVILLVLGGPFAKAGSYQRTRDGKVLFWSDEDPKKGYVASWSGRRDKDGYATGYGTLTWFAPAKSLITGTNIPSWRGRARVASYSGEMVQGKFVDTTKATPTPSAKEQARNQRRKSILERGPSEGRPATKTRSPAPTEKIPPTASPSPSATAAASPSSAAESTPSPSPRASDESLNSLARPPSSLGLSPTPGTTPAPEGSASPSPR